ncbi:hypothetical protein BXZ70DRAFT_326627 [Cristinia sonorae]|uniref:NADAR domain-containing protein n=1 Tax=Cristinia sonorae TaxID=1940300 RepID=A0A8K0UK36_9AGAR|nr:hypothetical protein BXZ70DRAFT_326627 [Cristinia sonorae]
MGNNSSRGGYDRRYYQNYYDDRAPGRSYSTRHRSKAGYHPSVLPPPRPREEEYEDDYDYEPPRSHVHRPTYPEPDYSYDHDPSYAIAQPGPIPFAPVQPAYATPPVIPHVPHNRRGRGHTYPAPAPPVQMPVPNVQPHNQHAPVIPPPPQHGIPQYTTSAGVNIPYPDANAPIIPPGQHVVFPATSASSAGHEPRAQMPEPHQHQAEPPAHPLAPGQYGPNDSDRQSPRRYNHRRVRSDNHHSNDSYDRRRHRHSIDSATHYARRRQESPLRNPLPSPPKDIFDRPDLADLLTNLRLPPEETTLKRDPNAPTHALIIPHNGAARVERIVSQPVHRSHQQHLHVRERSGGEKEKKKGGIFRSLSAKLKPKHHHRESRHYQRDEGGIPIQDVLTTRPIIITAEEQMLPPPVPPIIPPPPVLESDAAGPSSAPIPPPGQYGPPGGTPAGVPLRMPSPSASTVNHQRAPSPSPNRSPRPTMLRMDSIGPFADLLHFSSHPVHYKNKLYPTAYHLYEAMKYLDHRPDIAERIRTSGSGREGVERAGEVSRDYTAHVRPDWERVMVDKMEEALYHKFIQHESARRILLATGQKSLIFSEYDDAFWGDGPVGQGLNHIGHILMRIRDQLRDAGYAS